MFLFFSRFYLIEFNLVLIQKQIIIAMIGRHALRQFSWRKSAVRIYSTQMVEVFDFIAVQCLEQFRQIGFSIFGSKF